MASTTAAAEDLLEVRCAGCGETLEVERGLTEFICPDCSTAQALPPELMPPPRRRRALPIPHPPARQSPVRLPCWACGTLLTVPLGLVRCGCPVCGVELAVDAARLRQYLLSTAASPLVPVSQTREGCQEYPDSAVCVGHIQGHPNEQLVHVDRSQVRRRSTHALWKYPDAVTDKDDMNIATEMLNEVTETHHHRTSLVAARTDIAKRRQVETLNHGTYQGHMQQCNHSVHAEHTLRVGEAQNESLNHAIHRVVEHTDQVTCTTVSPKSASMERRQVQTLNQITGEGQVKTGPPNLLSPVEPEPENSNENIQTEQDDTEMDHLTSGLAHKSTKRNLTPSNKGFEHRCSKRFAKQSAAPTYHESPENESEENGVVSPSRTIPDSEGIDQASDDISSSSSPQHSMPHRSSNEAENLHATPQYASSIPDMSDPESFAHYYSKICPPEVRRALQRNLNLGHAGGC